ncbi:MAG: CHAD domain-containing protein [Gammaproteobacteria bacterium]|nr:CHAD domain-containing protein [Gammaproteobacteria bacterium]
MNDTVEFILPGNVPTSEVEKFFTGQFAAARGPEYSATLRFHDTFDWRLYRAGWVLEEATRGRRGVVGCYNRRTGDHVSIPVTGRLRHLHELGGLQEERDLRGVVGLRALIAQAQLPVRVSEIKLLNDDQKTVVHCRVGQYQAPDAAEANSEFTAIRLLGLRGYTAELRIAAARIASATNTTQRECAVLHRTMEVLGQTLDEHAVKPHIRLPPSATALQWMSAICTRLVDVMVSNEAGIVQDIDTEFLHDFRVAVRRTRSALGQIRGVYKTESITRFSSEFAWLGQVTGPLRDLDVFLLHFDELRASVPVELHDGLQGFNDYLRGQRIRERRRILKHLRGERYHSLVEDWRCFLAEPGTRHRGGAAGQTVVPVAREHTLRIWRRVLKQGRCINDSSPPQALHDLRISCKKLRYMLEFFTPLQTAGNAGHLTRRLRRLQENLGDFQDCSVQIETLYNIAHQTAWDQPDTVLALGALIQQATDRGTAARQDFHRRFQSFDTRSTARLFERLFAQTQIKVA